ncbi:MAG: esterase-like activity of phytase family protein [Nitrosospira sp.]|nr:esterase-like activity of phytase family protein [Nitrosospira sp.]
MNFIQKTCTAVLTASVLAAPAYAVDFAANFSLHYLGQQIVPTGATFAGTTIGGLSSLDYSKGTGRYLAISDDRGNVNPARFYELSLNLDKFERSATPGHAGVSFNTVTTIQKPAGGAFSANTVDPEGLRFDPARNTIYWSDEGQRSVGGYRNPTVKEMNTDGSHVRDFAAPNRYHPSGSVAGITAGDKGVYNNLGFESLAISKDGRTLYTATENGLAQDSLPASVVNGSQSRILSFDIATGQSKTQYIYYVSPVAQTPGTPVTGNTIRLFYADARNATDVSGFDSISGKNVNAVTKTLLLDLSNLKHDDGTPLALDNIEGITFGPQVSNKETLILVSDNNFNNAQFTQFVALQITPVPEPETKAMLLAGLVLVSMIVRRGKLMAG